MNNIITKYSQLVMPQDANVVGTLFGGQMVSWMDIAAAKSVHRFLKGTKIPETPSSMVSTCPPELDEIIALGFA